jgi:hypothetical protein
MLTSNFPKEAYLVRKLARTSLPVAPLVRVGRLGDLHFAISRKLPGKMLQEHTPQEVQALHRERNKQHECRQNQPLMSCEICIPPSCCAVAHDDEQTRHETHVYKTMLRRIEPTERCYDERDDEELRTMDDATKE